MQKTLSSRLRERGNEGSLLIQPSIQTSPALLRSSPARSERLDENCMNDLSLAQPAGIVNSSNGRSGKYDEGV